MGRFHLPSRVIHRTKLICDLFIVGVRDREQYEYAKKCHGKIVFMNFISLHLAVYLLLIFLTCHGSQREAQGRCTGQSHGPRSSEHGRVPYFCNGYDVSSRGKPIVSSSIGGVLAGTCRVGLACVHGNLQINLSTQTKQSMSQRLQKWNDGFHPSLF